MAPWRAPTGKAEVCRSPCGWNVVESWPMKTGRNGKPLKGTGLYVLLDRGMNKADAESFADRLRKSFGLN